MQLSPFPCHLVPLRSKYAPQHPILKHPQPALLPRCQRPCFTPIQNHRQNYSSIYLNTVCATRNIISPVKYVLYLYSSTFHSLFAGHTVAGFCSSLISSLHFTFSGIFSVILRLCQSPCYYRYNVCFHIPHVLNLFCKIFIS